MAGIGRLALTCGRARPARILRRFASGTPRSHSSAWADRSRPAGVSAPAAGAGAAADARADGDSVASPSATLDRAAADRLLELVWPERSRLAAGVGLSVLGSGLSLAFPAMIGVMVDVTLSPESALVSPNAAAGGLLAIFGGQAVILTARAQLLAIAGENISATMRTRAFGSLLRQEVAFFDRHETGELLNRLSADCAQLQKAVTSTCAQALRSGTMAVGSAGMLFALSPQLGALILAIFPAVFVLGAWQGRAMRAEQKAVQRALSRAGALAARSLTSLRTLRALGVEQAQLDGYSHAIGAARAQAVTVGVRAAVFDASVHLAANLSLLGVMARGSMLVGAGELSAGALSSVVLYALWVGFASSQLAQCYADAARAAGASERLLQLMSREPRMNATGGVRLALPTGARGLPIEFDEVRFAYASRVEPTDLGGPADDLADQSPAADSARAPTAADARAPPPPSSTTAHDGSIRALSLAIGAGERVGLVGASGCGKSTLLRLISRLYDVDGGAVRLGGVDVRALEPRQLRGGLVAVVPQEPALLAGTIRHNIALCSRFDGAEAETALAAAVEAAELGPLVRSLPDGLDTQVGEGGVTLSGGEKQRVAIARMLLADPAVVLLDEFTSALDDATEARVAAQLRPLLAGRTVLAVAHRASALRGLDVRRVIELGSGGRIVRDLGLDEWLRSQPPPSSAADDDRADATPSPTGTVGQRGAAAL